MGSLWRLEARALVCCSTSLWWDLNPNTILRLFMTLVVSIVTIFHFFGENAVTSIFAKGWDSLGLSKKLWTKPRKLVRKSIHFFWRKCHHFDFCQGMGFTTIFEKNGEKNFENWPENEFCILPHLRPISKGDAFPIPKENQIRYCSKCTIHLIILIFYL